MGRGADLEEDDDDDAADEVGDGDDDEGVPEVGGLDVGQEVMVVLQVLLDHLVPLHLQPCRVGLTH